MNIEQESIISLLDLTPTNEKKEIAIEKGIHFYNWYKNNIFFDIRLKKSKIKTKFLVEIKDNYGALIYFNLFDLEYIYVYLYDFNKSEPINLISLGYGREHKFKRFKNYWDVLEELLNIYYFI